tara:strand:+ start:230 stop:889 length:660 start_codon:yes stop_codon:yes gene_type:complete
VKNICTTIFFLFFVFLVSAQESNFGNWLIHIGSKKINTKFNLHHEIQYRNYNAIGDLEQLLIRTGIGYNLSENNNNLLFGYGYIASENYFLGGDKMRVNEHRIFQQFITKQNSGRFFWGHRYRFEQRFIEENYKMRLRYFINLRVPINKNALDPGAFFISGYNEIFMDVNKETAFDRNRLYGGLGYQLSKGLKIEVGYMNQFLSTFNRDQFNVFLFSKF